MKHLFRNIAILLSCCFCFNIAFSGNLCTTADAAPLTKTEKAKRAREKEKAKRAREKEKAKRAREKEKAKAKQSKQKTQSKQKNYFSSREEYKQKVAEIEAYNSRVDSYNARDITHSIGAWGQVGYSAIVPSRFTYQEDPALGFNARAKGGVGGGVGLGYQMRYQRFLLQTGLEFQTYNSCNILYSSDKRQPILTRQLPITISSPSGSVDAEAIYTFSGTTDQLVAGYLQLPILVGYQMQSVPLYVLAGSKLGINILHTSRLSSDVSVCVHDNELVENLGNLETHHLSSAPLTYSSSPRFAFNLALAAEFGMRLDDYMPAGWRMCVGAFIEYGVLSIQSSANTGTMDIPFSLPNVGEDVDQFAQQMCSSLETSSAATARLNPLLVGVRVSVMYDLPRKQMQKKALPKEPKASINVPHVDIVDPDIPIDTMHRIVTFGDIPLRVGMKVTIDNLFFATNRTEVLPQSGLALEKLADFMKDNPSVHILLIGHTDSIGTERANQILSEGRVQSVKNELIRRGVEANRMAVEGRGESQPVNTNSTEEGRQHNRRVEFTITSMDEE